MNGDYVEEDTRSSRDGNGTKSSENEDNDQCEAARGVAFLSLNAGGNPIYVGPSSGFSWARMVLGGMAGASSGEGGKYGPTRSKLDTRAPFDAGNPAASTPQLDDHALESIDDDLANRIYQAVYEFVQVRKHPNLISSRSQIAHDTGTSCIDEQSQFCFLDWLWIRSIFPHRVKICRAANLPGASTATRTGLYCVSSTKFETRRASGSVD